MIKDNSGKVATTGTIIYSFPQFTTDEKIIVSFITFTNISAFNITLEVYNKRKNKIQQIYYYELDAGDVVNDSTPYELQNGDYLKATCNIAGTNFLIQIK